MAKDKFQVIEFQVGDRVVPVEPSVGKCTIAHLYLQPVTDWQTVYYAELISNVDGQYYKVPVDKLKKE